MKNLERLMADLEHWQKANGLSDASMAQQLGDLDRSTWAAYRLGLRQPGRVLVMRARGVRGFARRVDAVLRGREYPE